MNLKFCETRNYPPALFKQLKRWCYKNGLWYDGTLNSILYIKDLNINVQFFRYAGKLWVRFFQRPLYKYSRISPVSTLKGLITKIEKFMSVHGLTRVIFEQIHRVYVPTSQKAKQRKQHVKNYNEIHIFFNNQTFKLCENVLQIQWHKSQQENLSPNQKAPS